MKDQKRALFVCAATLCCCAALILICVAAAMAADAMDSFTQTVCYPAACGWVTTESGCHSDKKECFLVYANVSITLDGVNMTYVYTHTCDKELEPSCTTFCDYTVLECFYLGGVPSVDTVVYNRPDDGLTSFLTCAVLAIILASLSAVLCAVARRR